MVEVAEFGEKYRQSVQKFSKENFEDRANLSYFTWYMVAIVNNCSIFGEQVSVPFFESLSTHTLEIVTLCKHTSTQLFGGPGYIKDRSFAWRAWAINDPLMVERLFSSVPPSNFLISVSDSQP